MRVVEYVCFIAPEWNRHLSLNQLWTLWLVKFPLIEGSHTIELTRVDSHYTGITIKHYSLQG